MQEEIEKLFPEIIENEIFRKILARYGFTSRNNNNILFVKISKKRTNWVDDTVEFADGTYEEVKRKIKWYDTVGYACAYVKNNTLFVGYSLWDRREWNGMRFRSKFGRQLALERAIPVSSIVRDEIPHGARDAVYRVIGKAIPFFQQINVTQQLLIKSEEKDSLAVALMM